MTALFQTGENHGAHEPYSGLTCRVAGHSGPVNGFVPATLLLRRELHNMRHRGWLQ